jgi:hypothetical protein
MQIAGEQVIATILKHDNKTTSYKPALLRAINDLVLAYPGMAQLSRDVAVPLVRIAELWAAYYWAFMDSEKPIYQGTRAVRDSMLRNDVGFRSELTCLRTEWEKVIVGKTKPADGFFLFAEMRTPRRKATYSEQLRLAYDKAIRVIVEAVKMPIRFAGVGQWSIFSKPDRLNRLPAFVVPLPGTADKDICVVVPASLWDSFHHLSLYIEALSIHEWSLFTETVSQEPAMSITRGEVYTLLTAHPDNRRPLTWERNQVDILLAEQVVFVCPWTQKNIKQSSPYDLDHLLPLAVYPINELWNLVPVDREFNQRVKRDRLPSQQRLVEVEPLLMEAYHNYGKSIALDRTIREEARQRFAGWNSAQNFSAQLARRTVEFIGQAAEARYVTRFT